MSAATLRLLGGFLCRGGVRAASSGTADAATQVAGPKLTAAARRGRRNLFELITTQPQFGVGTRVARSLWKGYDTYFTVTKVRPSKDLRHGTAWGVQTWRGQSQQVEQRIPGALKKEWRFFTPPPPPAELKRTLRSGELPGSAEQPTAVQSA